jgi:hypothetical protein
MIHQPYGKDNLHRRTTESALPGSTSSRSNRLAHCWSSPNRRQPKRKRPTKAVPAAITGPRIVSAKAPGKVIRPRKETPIDPEAEARIAEFFARMIRPL